MRYYFTMLGWVFRLHLMKWSRYRSDVVVWLIAIWLMLGIQACFLYVTYNAVEGNLFGYTQFELIGFLGITILATGIAQCIVAGITMHLARVVWSGQFDYWLTQPAPLFFRMLLEDIGLIWYWPHFIVGIGLVWWAFPGQVFLALFASFFAGILEAALIFCLCVPAIRWGKWDPNEGIWEYIESSRSVPLGKIQSFPLLLASFGVLQYSIALSMIAGSSPLWLLPAVALAVCLLAWWLMNRLVRSYSSASS